MFKRNGQGEDPLLVPFFESADQFKEDRERDKTCDNILLELDGIPYRYLHMSSKQLGPE